MNRARLQPLLAFLARHPDRGDWQPALWIVGTPSSWIIGRTNRMVEPKNRPVFRGGEAL